MSEIDYTSSGGSIPISQVTGLTAHLRAIEERQEILDRDVWRVRFVLVAVVVMATANLVALWMMLP